MNADEQVLVDLNERLGEAERTRDVRYLADVLVDDLIFRRASGVRVGKAQYLEELANPENTYARLESKQIEALIHRNDVALVSLP